jgi:FkbM family methyltransferase
MDIDKLQRSGHSTTSWAWLKNPIRKGFFIALRPYLAEIAQALNSTQETIYSTLKPAQNNIYSAQENIHSTLNSMQEYLKDYIKTHGAEVTRIGLLMDGLRKDQLASAHRLGNLEDSVDGWRCEIDNLKKQFAEQLLQLGPLADALQGHQPASDGHFATPEARHAQEQQQVEVIPVPAPTEALMPNHTLAITGTSLVLNSGRYGCFLLRQPDLISDHILAGSFWDEHLKPIIEQAGRHDGSAIDAGAYLGFHSTYMSRFFRTVYAFEPQVEIYRMLCANLLINNCRNVIALNRALYSTSRPLRLADKTRQEIPLPMTDGTIDYDRIGNAAALTLHLADESDPHGICTQTIDQLGLTDLAFIKVDTQGSDLHVLKGAGATIQRCSPMIAVEYERDMAQSHGHTLEHYHQFFDEMGYDVRVLNSRGDGKQIDLLATPR